MQEFLLRKRWPLNLYDPIGCKNRLAKGVIRADRLECHGLLTRQITQRA